MSIVCSFFVCHKSGQELDNRTFAGQAYGLARCMEHWWGELVHVFENVNMHDIGADGAHGL